MALQIYVRDRKGAIVNQPEIDRAVGLRYASMWPKGHTVATFTVNRDIARHWHVKEAYDVIIKDGHKVIYQGLINNLRASISGLGQQTSVECSGYYLLLSQRSIQKYWVDNSPLERFYWPSGRAANANQNALLGRIRNNALVLSLPDRWDGVNGDDMWWQYDTVSGNFIDRVTYDVWIGSTDGFAIRLYNMADTATWEHEDDDGTGSYTANVDHTLTRGDTSSIQIRQVLTATDSDYFMTSSLYNMVIYVSYTAAHPQFGSEEYYADEIAIDCLLKEVEEISQDYDDIVSPGLALLPFTTKDGLHEPLDSVIQRAVNYGDAAFNTYGFSIWDNENTSDNLPRAELKQRPALDDWDYEVSLNEVTQFSYEPSLDQLHNYLHIRYTNSLGQLSYLSAEDTDELKDTTSIQQYGRRDKVLGLGKADSTTAQSYGERWLALHKDPLVKTRLTYTRRNIRRKDGAFEPTAWLRAGCRVKITDYEDGLIFLVRRADHNAEDGTVRLESDIPPDGLSQFTAQQTLGLEVVTTREPIV